MKGKVSMRGAKRPVGRKAAVSVTLEELLRLDGLFIRAERGKPRLDRPLPVPRSKPTKL